MRSDRLSETAQDAYTLVLEMSRPEPNIQIAYRNLPRRAGSLTWPIQRRGANLPYF
jgi:hypothetical protein